MGNDLSVLRAAVYCRKSSEEGLEQSFNSLHAQREACEAFVISQRHEGWRVIPAHYDDGGYSGGSMDRPALQQLLQDVENAKVNIIVVYKVDRLTRSLADFAKIIEILDVHRVSFVSVTQQFNTTTSMGRLTLNVLLSFAQFEREVTGERIRDKIAASKKKGMWMGGFPPLGYDVQDRKLIPNLNEAAVVKKIFGLYLDMGCVSSLKGELDRTNAISKIWKTRNGASRGGVAFSRGALYDLLQNRLYIGEVRHLKLWYPGLHEGIISRDVWDRVQSQMATNRERRLIRIREQSSSLLTGLIEDRDGNPFTPSFTVKSKKRYRYYVSRTSIGNLATRAQSPVRWPAKELETAVLDVVQSFLSSEARVFGEYDNGDSSDVVHELVSAAKKLADGWPSLGPGETRKFVSSCVRRVVVDRDSVGVLLDKLALSNQLLGHDVVNTKVPRFDANSALISLKSRAKLRRCGGEVCLLIPATGGERKIRCRPVPSLVKAIVRARLWYERLLSGESEDCTALAAEVGLGDRYVARVLHFAFLAPDIVESILDGTHPPDLTFAKMATNIPLSWVEQHERFGFTALPVLKNPRPGSALLNTDQGTRFPVR